MSPAPAAADRPADVPATLVKCVVWDIDNTLLDGVYLEAGERLPAADPVLAGVLAELSGRGIVHAVASKNPPAAAAHAARVTGCDFAAVECGWGAKSQALARIAAGLAIGADALAFVDDDPYERAEVSAALPQVLVLSPEDAAEAVRWPEFRPPVLTEEGRRRGELYAARQRRLAAERGFGGGRDDFLRAVGTRVTIAVAAAADAPRLHELAVRTRQFNSAARVVDEPGFAALIASGAVITVRLRDSYADDGIVGGCVIERRPATWTVPLVMMSCRAMGRGVIEALLAWLARAAARAGAGALEIACQLNERNVPLRLALASAGFRAGEPAGEPAPARPVFRRGLAGPLPGLPAWVAEPGTGEP